MENISFRKKNYLKTEEKNNDLKLKKLFNSDIPKLKTHLKISKEPLSQDKKKINDLKSKFFHLNEKNRRTFSKNIDKSIDDDLASSLLIKNYKIDKMSPTQKKFNITFTNKFINMKKNNGSYKINNHISLNQLNSQNNFEDNSQRRKSTKKTLKIILKHNTENEKNEKKNLFLLPVLKSVKRKLHFKIGETVDSFSDLFIPKKSQKKNLQNGFSLKKNLKNNIFINRYYENNTEENDMKPNIRFKNLKKELQEETSKISKMFVGFNKEVSEEDFLIRIISKKMSSKRKKESSNSNPKNNKKINS